MVKRLVNACAPMAGLAHPALAKGVLKNANTANAWTVNASATVDLWETIALFLGARITAMTMVSATRHLALLFASVL